MCLLASVRRSERSWTKCSMRPRTRSRTGHARVPLGPPTSGTAGASRPSRRFRPTPRPRLRLRSSPPKVASSVVPRAGESCSAVADQSVRIRGRSTRERRIAEQATAQVAERKATAASADVSASGTPRARLPDLSAITRLLAGGGEVQALADRFRTIKEGRVGQGLKHVTYAQMPHGSKSFLAAALAIASKERLVWVARDSEIADRVAEELQAWLGDPDGVITLEPRTSLAYERSELIRDESAARVASLAAWRSGVPQILVASVQALFQHTLAPSEVP